MTLSSAPLVSGLERFHCTTSAVYYTHCSLVNQPYYVGKCIFSGSACACEKSVWLARLVSLYTMSYLEAGEGRGQCSHTQPEEEEVGVGGGEGGRIPVREWVWPCCQGVELRED